MMRRAGTQMGHWLKAAVKLTPSQASWSIWGVIVTGWPLQCRASARRWSQQIRRTLGVSGLRAGSGMVGLLCWMGFDPAMVTTRRGRVMRTGEIGLRLV